MTSCWSLYKSSGIEDHSTVLKNEKDLRSGQLLCSLFEAADGLPTHGSVGGWLEVTEHGCWIVGQACLNLVLPPGRLWAYAETRVCF